MNRPRIDKAIHAQIDRLTYLLRDVVRSGGNDRWSHLFSHGHKFPTVRSAVSQGYLRQLTGPYLYEITDAGRRYLDTLDEATVRGLND